MSRRALALLTAATLLASGAAVRAEPEDGYGPVPPGIEGIVASERDRALASMGLATLESGRGAADLPISLLVMLDEAGLKAVATRLASGKIPPGAMAPLLEVVAASEHPEADILLERAAREARPELRTIAADALGRGRSPRAVPILARLARDEVPGVRIAALRSLFAIETPQAVAARMAVPADGEPDLFATRLRWHRRCADVSPALRQTAIEAYRTGRGVALRMEAAQYLTRPESGAPEDVLASVIHEMGSGPLAAAFYRWGHGLPRRGYDAVQERQVAIDAALTLLSRPGLDPRRRAALIDQALGWVAQPVSMDARGREPIPEHRLRRLLPDFGAEVLAPLVRRLRRGDFTDPRPGMILLRELGAELAAPVLREMVRPRKARPPFESRAETERLRYLRNAAASALQELGQVGDEQLARALVFGDERDALKVDILHALETEPGEWAVAVLGEVVASGDSELRTYALNILERRGGPAAHEILVDDLFARMDRPYDRLGPLVTRGDDEALAVIRRALSDERSYMRKQTLKQFHRRIHPRLHTEKGREVLYAHEPDLRSLQETQDYVYALLSTAPGKGVAYVRAGWERFPTVRMRMTLMQVLKEAHGKSARNAAIDLALEKFGRAKPFQMLMSAAAVFGGPTGRYEWTHRADDVGAFWHRLLMSDDVRLQRAAIESAYTHEKAPDVSDRLLELLARARAGEAIPERDSTPEGEQTFARLLIGALSQQAWAKVESTLLDVVTDPLGEGTTRMATAELLVGRLSDAGRARVMEWLDVTQPEATADPKEADRPGASAGDALQLFLAAAVGEEADATVAATLHATLKRELFSYFSPTRLARLAVSDTPDPEADRLDARITALARGIGHTGHAPTIDALLDLVFDIRFAILARIAVDRQAKGNREATAHAAAVVPSSLNALAHREAGSYFGMPGCIYNLLYEVKRLDDELLAAAFARVMGAARADGRLAQFPLLFLERVARNMLDPLSGRKPMTAAVVMGYARRAGRPDGPIHYFLADSAVRELANAGRFEEAARRQRDVVRIVARGNHDDRWPGVWVLQRAVADALAGAAAAARGEDDAARALFRSAVLRAPNDPDVLNSVAWYRALADFELDQAEADARRATLLEARVENHPTRVAADTFAYVLLKRGRPGEGLSVLRPRIRERSAVQDGTLYMHLGQLYAALEMYRSARDALVDALVLDRALEDQLRADRYLSKLREKVTIDEIAKRARAKRREKDIP